MAPVLQATMSVCGLAPGHAFRPQSALPRHPSHRGVCSPMRTHDQHHSVAFQRPIVTMRAGRGPAQSQDDNNDDDGESGPYVRDTEYEERVIQVRRVTKVVKGGKQLSFRAVVVVGNNNGTVGVASASAKEVAQAAQKAVLKAKRRLITVPLTRNALSVPHAFDSYFSGAKVLLRPASEGTGVIAGGAVRVVLELAGVRNGFGKQVGGSNPLNNAKAAIEGLRAMRTLRQVAAERDISVAQLLGLPPKKESSDAVPV
ncbi:PRPS5 [Auxenochlorella protothecoides x Auxenochlorella symbiontica]